MKTFNEIACESFKLKESDIVDTLAAKDVPNWDSMNYLFFIAELEKTFDISFSMDEVMNAQCIGDIRKIVIARSKKA